MYRTYTKGTVYKAGDLSKSGTPVVTEWSWKSRRDAWRYRFHLWWLIYKFDHRWPVRFTETTWEFDNNLPREIVDWIMTRGGRAEPVETTTYWK